jgi:hypothetical protein
MMINGRVGRWVEFRFWQMVVRGLSLLRPVHKRLAAHRIEREALSQAKTQAFVPTLFTALTGWGVGLLLGFMLMSLWF